MKVFLKFYQAQDYKRFLSVYIVIKYNKTEYFNRIRREIYKSTKILRFYKFVCYFSLFNLIFFCLYSDYNYKVF